MRLSVPSGHSERDSGVLTRPCKWGICHAARWLAPRSHGSTCENKAWTQDPRVSSSCMHTRAFGTTMRTHEMPCIQRLPNCRHNTHPQRHKLLQKVSTYQIGHFKCAPKSVTASTRDSIQKAPGITFQVMKLAITCLLLTLTACFATQSTEHVTRLSGKVRARELALYSLVKACDL